jgi:hypothetical protein
LVYYLYRYYDANLQRWPNRDPVDEPGFEVLTFSSSSVLRAIAVLERMENNNLYAFVHNQAIGNYDPLGLAPDTGPNSLACASATEFAEAARDAWRAEPSQENAKKLLAAVAKMAAACKPPPDPPQSCPDGGGGQPPNLWPIVKPTLGTILIIGIIIILSPVGA